MKQIALFLFALILPFSLHAQTSGEVLELHSLELYTGGCTASAEAASGGKNLLRVWKIGEGRETGVDLSGLDVAVLQISDTNQIHSEIAPVQLVIYLPEKASPAQREALCQWVLKQDATFSKASFATRVLPIDYQRSGARVALKIGEDIRLETAELGKCETGACGQQLWYEPRSRVTRFEVLFNQHSAIREKDLNLVWNDHGKPTVFLGQFKM